MRRSSDSRRGFTAVELVLVIVVLAIVVSVTMIEVERRMQAREMMLREQSVANLKKLYSTFGFIVEVAPVSPEDPTTLLFYKPSNPPEIEVPVSPGANYVGLLTPIPQWLPLSNTPGQLVPQLRRRTGDRYLAPLESATALISPAHPDVERMRKDALADPVSALTDESYWYLPYAIPNEAAGLAFVEDYMKAVKETGKPWTESAQRARFTDRGTERETEGPSMFSKKLHNPFTIKRSIILKPDPNIPMMIERPGLQRGGSHVLFEDGHVDFIPYPGPWPMTEKFIKALESLDELKEPSGDTVEK